MGTPVTRDMILEMFMEAVSPENVQFVNELMIKHNQEFILFADLPVALRKFANFSRLREFCAGYRLNEIGLMEAALRVRNALQDTDRNKFGNEAVPVCYSGTKATALIAAITEVCTVLTGTVNVEPKWDFGEFIPHHLPAAPTPNEHTDTDGSSISRLVHLLQRRPLSFEELSYLFDNPTKEKRSKFYDTANPALNIIIKLIKKLARCDIFSLTPTAHYSLLTDAFAAYGGASIQVNGYGPRSDSVSLLHASLILLLMYCDLQKYQRITLETAEAIFQVVNAGQLASPEFVRELSDKVGIAYVTDQKFDSTTIATDIGDYIIQTETQHYFLSGIGGTLAQRALTEFVTYASSQPVDIAHVFVQLIDGWDGKAYSVNEQFTGMPCRNIRPSTIGLMLRARMCLLGFGATQYGDIPTAIYDYGKQFIIPIPRDPKSQMAFASSWLVFFAEFFGKIDKRVPLGAWVQESINCAADCLLLTEEQKNRLITKFVDKTKPYEPENIGKEKAHN